MSRIVMIAVVLMLGTATAFAQSDRDWRTCNSDDDDAAITACTRLIKAGRMSRKDLAVVHYNRGLSLRRKDRLDEAIADYTKSLEYDANDPKVYNNRGVAYELKRDFDLAIADYERSMRLDPKSPNPYSNRGDVHKKRGDFERAIADYSHALTLDPNRPFDHSDLAEAYMLTGRYDLARASASRSVELDPDRAPAYFARGVSAFYQGRYGEAADDLRRSLDLRLHSYTILYDYIARARAGDGSTQQLREDAGRLSSKAWPWAVIEMFLDRRSPSSVMAAADRASEKCDAHYFAAHWQILHGNTTEYRDHLRSAAEVCPQGDFERMGAKAELSRLP